MKANYYIVFDFDGEGDPPTNTSGNARKKHTLQNWTNGHSAKSANGLGNTTIGNLDQWPRKLLQS